MAPLDRYDFTFTVAFPDGGSGEVEQTGAQRDERQGVNFYVRVRREGAEPLSGRIYLGGSSLYRLDASSGRDRKGKSACVIQALTNWVKEHGLRPNFVFEVTLDRPDEVELTLLSFPDSPS